MDYDADDMLDVGCWMLALPAGQGAPEGRPSRSPPTRCCFRLVLHTKIAHYSTSMVRASVLLCNSVPSYTPPEFYRKLQQAPRPRATSARMPDLSSTATDSKFIIVRALDKNCSAAFVAYCLSRSPCPLDARNKHPQRWRNTSLGARYALLVLVRGRGKNIMCLFHASSYNAQNNGASMSLTPRSYRDMTGDVLVRIRLAQMVAPGMNRKRTDRGTASLDGVTPHTETRRGCRIIREHPLCTLLVAAMWSRYCRSAPTPLSRVHLRSPEPPFDYTRSLCRGGAASTGPRSVARPPRWGSRTFRCFEPALSHLLRCSGALSRPCRIFSGAPELDSNEPLPMWPEYPPALPFFDDRVLTG